MRLQTDEAFEKSVSEIIGVITVLIFEGLPVVMEHFEWLI